MRDRSVVRLIPSRAAAPSAPPTRPLHRVSAFTISSRCFAAYSPATASLPAGADAGAGAEAGASGVRALPVEVLTSCFLRSSASGASSDLPRVRITARSMKFSSSRTLPGQSQRRKHLHDRDRHGLNPFLHLPRKLLHEVTDQQRNILLALPQGRHPDRKHVQPVIQDRCGTPGRAPSLPGRDWSPRPAAYSPCACACCPAVRIRAPAARAAASAATSGGMSPISSRNSVPWSASSKRPIFCAIAPVNAPFSWPNSSLSSSPVGMAAQFTFTNGCWLRAAALVNGARHQFLARARLAQHQHGRIARRHRLHQFAERSSARGCCR